LSSSLILDFALIGVVNADNLALVNPIPLVLFYYIAMFLNGLPVDVGNGANDGFDVDVVGLNDEYYCCNVSKGGFCLLTTPRLLLMGSLV